MANTAQFPPGQMLDDKYRIDHLISVGGMGAVYAGTHIMLRKKVAIKVLRTELAGSTAMIERFQREAVTASQIGHENIVSVTDMGTTAGGVAFLVMELLEGRSLAQAIRTDGPLPTSAACDVAAEVLSGVAAAHKEGIVHRDLKPENIFLVRRTAGKGEAVKILDFGISSIGRTNTPEPRLTQTGVVMGTPNYMAPEQARGDKDITAAADIYSVGVILYEMLSRQLPYEAENYNLLMYRVLSGEHIRLVQRRPELPVEIDAIIERAMTLEPFRRFADAEAFEAALVPYRSQGSGQHVVQLPITSPPMSRPLVLEPTREMATDETVSATPAPPEPKATPLPRAVTEPPPRSRTTLYLLLVAAVLGVAAAAIFATGGKPKPAPVAVPVVSIDAAPLAVPAPAEISVDFAVSVPGASIRVGDQALPGTRWKGLPGDKPVVIRIEAPGYEPYEVQLVLDRSMVVPVSMSRAVAAPEPTVSKRPRPSRPTAKPVEPIQPTTPEPPPAKKPKDPRIVTDSPYATPTKP